jgi:signal transduction histidine kinase
MTVAAVGGLLIAIMVIGLVGLGLNQSITDTVALSLGYDVELEDTGQDLTAAAFQLRESHRALDIDSPTPDRETAFERAYRALQDVIDRLEALGVRDQEVAQPAQLRGTLASYYEMFQPALPLYSTDLLGYERISDLSLAVLDELDRQIKGIDKLGEQRFRAGLRSVEREAASARLVLLWVVGGLAVVGTVVGLAAVRMVGVLRGLYARERAAAQAKADFLADVAHELRTPLTVLRTNADVGVSLDRDSPQALLFQEIVGESERMARMLQDLLLLARSDSTVLPLDREPVDMARFLADLAGRAQMLVEERGAIFESRLGGRGRMWIDLARIEQVVFILLDNATKYSPPGSCVTLGAIAHGHEARIEVADRGIGIPQDELPYVFDRFFRADHGRPRARKVDGVGLGLSIARAIVEAHGGRISATSRPGGGTSVAFGLPLLVTTS